MCVCAIGSLTCRDKERAGETTQTVSSWFLLASHVGQFINLLYSDAPNQPTHWATYQDASCFISLVTYMHAWEFFFFCVCLFWNLCLPLCAYLTIYWVFCVFMMCLRVCINPSIHICTHAYSKNVFWCLCEPVCVAFEICRGGCLSLCTRQSFCHDSQTAKKKKREEWESKRRKGRMRTGGKRDSEAELELENCFRHTVCVRACVSVCAF